MFFVQISLGLDVWTLAAHHIKCGRTAHTPALREHIGPKQDREGTINPQLHNFFAGGRYTIYMCVCLCVCVRQALIAARLFQSSCEALSHVPEQELTRPL